MLLKNKNDTLLLINEKLRKLVISLKEYSNKEEERFISRFSKTLKDIFSPTQIEMLLNPKKKFLNGHLMTFLLIFPLGAFPLKHIDFYETRKNFLYLVCNA